MSNRKRKQAFSDLVTGLFMIAVLALLGYFTIVISGISFLTNEKRVAGTVFFDEVGGLKEHDSVMFRGAKVGTVERIEITPSNLVVTIEVDSTVCLRESCSATVRALTVLGGNYLVLDAGHGKPVDLSGHVIRGVTPTDWMRDLSNIAKNLSEVTSGGEMKAIVTNLEATTVRARMIADRLERGEGTLGKLLAKDDTVYRDLQATLANAAVASASFREAVSNATIVTARVKDGKGALGKLLSEDAALYEETRASVAAFHRACESFDLGDGLKKDVSDVSDRAKKLLDSLNVVAARLERGEGTLGKLMTDEKAYQEINGLIKDVRQVIDNYRDTTPISTFSSLAAGAL